MLLSCQTPKSTISLYVKPSFKNVGSKKKKKHIGSANQSQTLGCIMLFNIMGSSYCGTTKGK